MTDELPIRVDVLYGCVDITSVRRMLPDGSIEFGCRVRTYDNKPSEPLRLASDRTEWGPLRIRFE